jgi:hypothetical protein
MESLVLDTTLALLETQKLAVQLPEIIGML